jgi:hypothetical protein
MKRRKVDAPMFRGVPNSARAKIIDHYKQNPEELDSSQSLAAHKHREMAQHDNLWKEWKVQMVRLKLKDGATMDWPLPNVSSLLLWHYECNPLFREAMVAAVKAKPNTPLRLIVYSDEFTPGNVLHPEQRKKCCMWYLSVMEFAQALSREHLWIPIAGLLSSKMKALSGTASQAHRVLMETALSDQLGICNSGILLSIDGVKTLVTAMMQEPIADELGLKSTYDIKGSSGIKPCGKCTNVFMKSHPFSGLPGNVDITCTDKTQFSPMEDADLYEASDALQAAAPDASKTKMKQLETDWGVNYSPDGVLQSAVLRSRMSPTRFRYDRLHVFESNGITDWEISLLLESLTDSKKFSNQQVADYCNAGWCVHKPGQHNAAVNLAIRDNSIKGMASDVLTAMPILHHFVCNFLQDWDDDKVESFKALFTVTAQLQTIKFSGICSAAETRKLADLIAKHCELFKKAYGSHSVRPKHHYAFHLPDQYLADGVYIDCFAMERHHQVCKAQAKLLHDTTMKKFEFFILSKVHRVMAAEAKASMQEPHGEEVMVNNEIAESLSSFNSLQGFYTKGSVILLKDVPHLVDRILKFRGRYELVLEKLQKHRDVHAFASEWQRLPGDCRSLLRWHVKEAWFCLVKAWF